MSPARESMESFLLIRWLVVGEFWWVWGCLCNLSRYASVRMHKRGIRWCVCVCVCVCRLLQLLKDE